MTELNWYKYAGEIYTYNTIMYIIPFYTIGIIFVYNILHYSFFTKCSSKSVFLGYYYFFENMFFSLKLQVIVNHGCISICINLNQFLIYLVPILSYYKWCWGKDFCV